MEQTLYIPSSLHIDKPLDGRRLSLSLHFYQFSLQQVEKLRNVLVKWAYALAGADFVFQWVCDGKSVGQKQFRSCLEKKLTPADSFFAAFDAYAISPIVYNSVTLRKFQRYVCTINPTYSFGWSVNPLLGGASIDYPPYIDDRIPINDFPRNDVVQAIYQCFSESKRKLLTLHNRSDFSGCISSKAYSANQDLYYGNANISFSAFCISSAIDEMAERFAVFAQQISDQFIQINAHVSLQPYYSGKSPYMRYFGKNVVEDGSHKDANCTSKEWYTTYYMCGVEWVNILSPLAKQHIPIVKENAHYTNDILVQSLPGGSLLVRSTKPITEYSISTAFLLKEVISPALYPGSSSVPLRGLFPRQGERRIYEWCPCFDWAIIPIDKNEIDIIGTYLTYNSKNSLNQID